MIFVLHCKNCNNELSVPNWYGCQVAMTHQYWMELIKRVSKFYDNVFNNWCKLFPLDSSCPHLLLKDILLKKLDWFDPNLCGMILGSVLTKIISSIWIIMTSITENRYITNSLQQGTSLVISSQRGIWHAYWPTKMAASAKLSLTQDPIGNLSQ